MANWLANLLNRKPETDAPSHLPEEGGELSEHSLDLEQQVQSLRLVLEERKQTLATLRVDLERERRQGGVLAQEQLQAQVEKIFTAVSGPVAQLLTQASLVEVEAKPVASHDILAVARRLVQGLEENGLQIEGAVGGQEAFDPNRHDPLQAGDILRPGSPVVVRLVGLSYAGKILRKAGVTALKE